MIDDSERYVFRIDDFAPDTMPFERLLAYYQEIKTMTGIGQHLRLLDVVEGSHGSAFAVTWDSKPALDKRLADVNAGVAPAEALRARDEINRMLEQDGTRGSFSDRAERNAVVFSGQRAGANKPPGAIHTIFIEQEIELTGILYQISGPENDANVRVSINSKLRGIVHCKTTRDVAEKLKTCLFECIRAFGRAKLKRTADGVWSVDDFFFSEFVKIEERSPSEIFDRIHALNLEWDYDMLNELKKLEDEDD